VERRDHIRAAQFHRARGGGLYGRLVFKADLQLRVFPGIFRHSWAGRGGDSAASTGFDQRRGHGTAVFLWVRLGGHSRADGPDGFVEARAARARGGCFEAGGLRRGARRAGTSRARGDAAANASDSARRVDGRGLGLRDFESITRNASRSNALSCSLLTLVTSTPTHPLTPT